MDLQKIISQFPQLNQFIDNDFILKQCEQGFKNHILFRLSNKETSSAMEKHLPSLEKRLVDLSELPGYVKLGNLMQGASTWDKYQDLLAQLDITLWFARNNMLEGIEPVLPHRKGYADILLKYDSIQIYCEVKSCASLEKSSMTNDYNKLRDKIKSLQRKTLINQRKK